MLKLLIEVMENLDKYKDHSFTETEEKLLLMVHYTLYGNSLKEFNMKTAFESIIRLSENKEIFEEVLEILNYKYNNLSVVSKKDRAMERSSLELHCTYTTDQILVALGKHTADKKYNFQEGVLHVKERDLDIDAFFITLNKVENHYSPSTMYKDYAISSELFHWQTQSKISPETQTCERYINHKKNNHKILLFVRERKKDKGFTTPFTYLGTADYVRHYGRLTVNIVWRLHESLPAGIEVKAEKAL